MARKSRVGIAEIPEIQSIFLYKAAIYKRLSDEDGDDMEADSLVNQEKIARHHIIDKPDIDVVGVYADNGYTGMNFKRPDFIRLKEDILLGKINCVIVKDVSRLGRNFVMTSEYVERIFPELGVRLICVNDGYDSADENADAGALMLPFKMVMNDAYSRDTSVKIRSSITAMMDNGEFLPPVGSIPYGYLRNAEENTFDIDIEVASTVQLIFKLRSEGMQFNTIAKELNDRGLPSPGRIRFVRGVTKDHRMENAQWIRGTVRKITNDPVYLGHRIHGKVKRDKLGMPKTRRPKDEWQIIENAHPAIISQELYDLVQKVNAEELEKRSGFQERAKPSVDYRNIFQDKIFCADCNSKMVAQKGCARHNAKTGSRLFYDCNGYKYSNHTNCSSHYIRQEVIMAAITNLLNKQVEVSLDIEKLIADVKKMPSVTRHQSSITDQIRSSSLKVKNMEEKIEQLLIDLTNGVIDRSEYEYMKVKYSQKLEYYREESEELIGKSQELTTVISTTQQWLNAIKEYKKLPEINRPVLDALVDKIYVSESKTIKIDLKYCDPYKPIMDYLQEVEVIANVS